jgi:hypothetical protein
MYIFCLPIALWDFALPELFPDLVLPFYIPDWWCLPFSYWNTVMWIDILALSGSGAYTGIAGTYKNNY